MAAIRWLVLTFPVFVCIALSYAQPVPAASNVKRVELTFTTIDVPGAEITGVFGINSLGDMVGYYGPDDGSALGKHGFLYRNGIFTTLDYPGADTTFAYGINDAGLVAGSAESHGGLTGTGFVYDGVKYTGMRTRQPLTFFWSLNNAGDIVGSAGIGGADFTGFVLRDGRFKIIDFPGEDVVANPTGINNFGSIAGTNIVGSDKYAYVLRKGRFKSLVFPGALFTQVGGINDHNVVVGAYFISPILYGFAYKNGRYLSFVYPGATATGATAINNSGQIVGQYQLHDLSWHGFVSSPIIDADFDVE